MITIEIPQRPHEQPEIYFRPESQRHTTHGKRALLALRLTREIYSDKYSDDEVAELLAGEELRPLSAKSLAPITEQEPIVPQVPASKVDLPPPVPNSSPSPVVPLGEVKTSPVVPVVPEGEGEQKSETESEQPQDPAK